MPTTSGESHTHYFRAELSALKQQIDRDIDGYWLGALPAVGHEYGPMSQRVMSEFADMMRRGGKRIRGALAAHAYRLFGGQDDDVALAAARLIEMMNAYILVIDDVIDRSELRRGAPTTHRRLRDWHRQAGWHGQSDRFGDNQAILAAMTGAHQAMLEIGRLNVPADLRLAALDNLNHLLVVTCHGQINDVSNEAVGTNDRQLVEHVLLWKTAYYTFANPLQFGALLAGASQAALDQLFAYSLKAGRAFQLSDDIIGIYGDEAATGKSPLDDMKEGKRTLLIVQALEQASQPDAVFLERMLGNHDLTMAELERCRQIIRRSGALAYAQAEVRRSVRAAQSALQDGVLPVDAPAVQFLHGLAAYLTSREA